MDHKELCVDKKGLIQMMSKDRVKFKIPWNRLSSNTYRQVIRQAFSLKDHEIPRCGDFTITCRPSQFARFLILRNNAGERNGFKELEPVLLAGDYREQPPKKIEVWDRKNTVWENRRNDEDEIR